MKRRRERTSITSQGREEERVIEGKNGQLSAIKRLIPQKKGNGDFAAGCKKKSGARSLFRRHADTQKEQP